MSAAEVIAQNPTPFEYAGLTYQLAVADYELELYFQSRHEAWTRNRIEATAAQVSEASYRADCEVFATQRAANRFAFGSALSLSWLLSDEGMSEYLTLLTQKGKKEKGGVTFDREGLRQTRRDDPAAWDRLVRVVLERDFPNLLAPTTAKPAGTTNGSSNCSPENPGSRAERKSSASAALTP